MCCKFRANNRVLQLYGIFMRCAKWVFRIFMLTIGPIMLFFANLLIVSIALIFFFHFYPMIYEESVLLFMIHACIGLYLTINIFYNYTACAFTHPGTPGYCPDPGKVLGERASIIDGRKVYEVAYKLNVAPYVSYRYCQVCKCIKPPRAHHDSITDKCILDMDHFCPWMNNCVGYKNYRYFILFMAYLLGGCLYVMAVTSVQFWSLPLDGRTYRSMMQFSSISAIAYSFTICASTCISILILLGWHVYLCLTNQTTIEFYINLHLRHESSLSGVIFKNPYDMGWRKNLRRVFGDVPWHRNLLPSSHSPPPPMYPFDFEGEIFEHHTV